MWQVVKQVRAVNRTCFQVVHVAFEDSKRYQEWQRAKYGMFADLVPDADLESPPTLICTGTAFIEDQNRLDFEQEWPYLKAAVVKYSTDGVETVIRSELGDYVSLYVRAEMRAKRAVMHDFFKSELPLIEGTIIILALLGWWTGRFVVYLAAWIRRGFVV